MKKQASKNKHLNTIGQFIFESSGLTFFQDDKTEAINIFQKSDKKNISFKNSDIKEILKREDQKKETFLQVNFKDGRKILLTKKLVGFAPASCGGLDIDKLPKVVTTADLVNVIEAIESSLYGKDSYEEDLSEVRLFFESIACGAESAGFNLVGERIWVERLISHYPTLIKKAYA